MAPFPLRLGRAAGVQSKVLVLGSEVRGPRSEVYGLRSAVYGLRSTVYGLECELPDAQPAISYGRSDRTNQ